MEGKKLPVESAYLSIREKEIVSESGMNMYELSVCYATFAANRSAKDEKKKFLDLAIKEVEKAKRHEL